MLNTPSAIALEFEDEGLTYQDLNQRANQLAHYLIEQGVKPDTLVGLCFDRSIEMVVGMLGILKAGGAYVPLDPTYPEARLAYQIDDAKLSVIITQECHSKVVSTTAPRLVVCLDSEQTCEYLKGLSKLNPDAMRLGLNSQNLAYVIYTSGTTGNPKGVLIEHQSVTSLVINNNYVPLSADTVMLCNSSVSFDAATFEIWGALLNGGRLAIQGRRLIDLTSLGSFLSEHRINTAFMTSRLFDQFVVNYEQALPDLRYLLTGGEIENVEMFRRVKALNPTLNVSNIYGPTENTTFSSSYQMPQVWDVNSTRLPIGKPLANRGVYVLDAHLALCPPGVTGELHVSGVGLARGYLNQPELTAQKFIANPFYDQNDKDSSERLYKTGDLVRLLPDGNLEFQGRVDHQVKLRGFRIELAEIEVHLQRQKSVLDALLVFERVTSKSDETASNDARLIAYLTINDGFELDRESLSLALSESLPEYMVPAIYIELSAFPLNINGKVDRAALPKPDYDQLQWASYEAPIGETEAALADIWQKLLNVERVSRNDNFFKLGGHSLLATRLISQANRALGIILSFKDVFDTPTLKSLASSVEAPKHDSFPELIPRSTDPDVCFSFAQRRLWLLDQIAGGSIHYNMSGSLSLHGELSVRALNEAFLKIVTRHEILRTRFIKAMAGEPAAQVQEISSFSLSIDDLSSLEKTERLQQKEKRLSLEAQKPFDLSQDLMIRAAVLKLGQNQHVLVVTTHHIACDGWSLPLLFSELGIIYNASLLGQEPDLKPLRIQYRDYARWQRSWLVGEAFDKSVDYWVEQLNDLPLIHSIPLDKPRPKIQTYAGATCFSTVGATPTKRLIELCKSHDATLFMGLQAAFSVLLSRYSNEDDIAIGTPIANREQADVEPLVGFFVNSLVLRSQLSEESTFESLLAQSKDMLLDAYTHQQVPFEQLVERLQPDRSLAYSSLFQIMLVLQNNDVVSIELSGLSSSKLDQSADNCVARYDLTLEVEEQNGSLSLLWKYNTDLFFESTIKRMAEQFGQLLYALCDAPQQSVFLVDMLPKTERHYLLKELNHTRVNYSGATLLHQIFEQQVVATPDAVAVTFGRQWLNYRDLNQRANQVAHYIRSLASVQSQGNALVAICVDRSAEMLVGLIGILKAGCAYIPMDPSYPNDRLEGILLDSRPVLLLAQTHILSRLPATTVPVLALDGDDETLHSQCNSNLSDVSMSPEDTVYVIYTSGSTGVPKGVAVPRRGMMNLLHWYKDEFEFSSQDKTLILSSFGFDLTQKNLFTPLLSGGTVCLGAYEFNPELINQTIKQEGVTSINLTPSAFYSLVDALEPDQRPFSSLRHVILGGEPINAARLKDLNTDYPDLKIVNSYGPTECSDVVSYHTLLNDQLKESRAIIPIGKPIANTQIYILTKQNQLAPTGVAGEICIAGAGVAKGYLNQAELTQERFITLNLDAGPQQVRSSSNAHTNPIHVYKTGDMGRLLPDGSIEYLGRNDFQVKLRGFRIELGEIETQLLSIKSVNAAVVVLDDNVSEDRLVAYVVADHEMALDSGSIRHSLKQTLPSYMVPTIFVELEALPLTRNGKIDRKALPKPKEEHISLADYEAPKGEVEVALAAIWQELFEIERVSRHDDFFGLGGHSLLASRLVAQVQHRLNRSISLHNVFEYSVLNELSTCLSRPHKDQPFSIMAVDRSQNLPLSSSQQRLWFIAQLDGGSAAYHISGAVRLLGNLSRDAVEKALITIVERHEALRTIFNELDGDIRQHIVALEESDFCVLYQDIESAQDVENTLQEVAKQFGQRPFDLSQGPLIRAQLVRLSSQEHVLLITMHHIVSDGWSMGVLVREFNTLYDAYRAGRANPLSVLPIQYVDYAAWQRRQLSGAVLADHHTYWQNQLTGSPELLTLPIDHPRPAVPSYKGGAVDISLGAELSRQVHEFALQEGVTVHMLLQAIWATLLSRLSGQSQIVIGTPVAGRSQVELEGLIGFFVNTLALRLDLNEHSDVKALLAHVKSVSLDAYEHQDMPFEQVVELVQPHRSLRYSPVFQTMFSFEHTKAEDGLTLSNVVSQGLNLDPAVMAKFDLTLSLVDADKGITGILEYAKDLFDHATIERWAQYLRCLINEFIAHVNMPLSQLTILPEGECNYLLEGLNPAFVNYDQASLMHTRFEEQVVLTPDAPALVFDDHSLSYTKLNQRANQLAHYLIDNGVRPDTMVGLCMERSTDVVVGLLGILKAGGVYVPLDPTYPEARLAYLIEDANLSMVLTQESLHSLVVSQSSVQALCFDSDEWCMRVQAYSTLNPNANELGLSPKHLAYVIYTSGTSGAPKGVMIEHRDLDVHVRSVNDVYGVQSSDRVLQLSSINFDPSIEQMFVALLNGATCYPCDNKQIDAHGLMEFIAKNHISVINVTPAYLNVLLTNPSWVDVSVERLRLVIVGGEALNESTLRQWQESVLAKRAQLINAYGPTETTITAATYPIDDTSEGTPPIGKMLGNRAAYIVDPAMNLCPMGVVGELLIGGVGLARGYLNQPILTAERFIDNSFYLPSGLRSGERLYKTGDLARWLPDGNIEYLGRVDTQVKLRGFRIELGEIEAQLLKHAAVQDAVVVLDGVDTDARLVAYTVLQDEVEYDHESLRQTLSTSLPEYMVPAVYVELEALPLTSNGKVDRKALPKPGDEYLAQAEYEAPQGETEVALAEIWQELLNVDQVSRHDNFFGLGGHSLLLIRLVSLVQQQLERSLSLQDVFENPVLKDISRVLDGAQHVALTPISVADRSQPLPLSWAQQRLWFIAQLEGASEAYHIPGAVRLRGALSSEALERALKTIVARHEALRTVFTDIDGDVWQEVTAVDVSELTLTRCDLRDAFDVDSALQTEAERFNEVTFDLRQGPLIRAQLVQLAEQDHVLLVTMHHIVSDAWSMRVLIREFNALYESYRQSQSNPLSALSLQYADYAVWQRTELSSELLKQQRDYWEAHLTGAPALLSLPNDHPRPATPSYRGVLLR